MGKGIFTESARFLNAARLYARVGLKRMTPLKAYRMMRYWFLTHVLKKNIPWLIELSVTYRCQCKCIHCSVGNYLNDAGGKPELSVEEIKRILDQAAEMGIPKVDFFGGEPLMKEGIVELVEYGEKIGLYISITTNAWLLTEDLAKQLGRAGLSCINVSLDSTEEEAHDKLRGLPGLHKKVVDAVKYCNDSGIPVIMSTYVTRKHIENFGQGSKDKSKLKSIIDFSKNMKAAGIRILFPIISGKWVKDKKKEFTEEERDLVIENIDTSFAFIEGAYSVKNKKKVCQSLSGKMFNISPYGDMHLCVAFTQSFGNIKDKHLRDLLADMYSHPIYKKNEGGSCCSTEGLAV